MCLTCTKLALLSFLYHLPAKYVNNALQNSAVLSSTKDFHDSFLDYLLTKLASLKVSIKKGEGWGSVYLDIVHEAKFFLEISVFYAV